MATFAMVSPKRQSSGNRDKTSRVAREWFWLHDRLCEVLHLKDVAMFRQRPAKRGTIIQIFNLLRKLKRWQPQAIPWAQWEGWADRLDGIFVASLVAINSWVLETKEKATKEDSAFRYLRDKDTRAWAKRACEGSGSGGHAFTKPPVGWIADPLVSGSQANPASEGEKSKPASLVENLQLWQEFWLGIWSLYIAGSSTAPTSLPPTAFPSACPAWR